MAATIQNLVTSGTFSLDGGTWEVDLAGTRHPIVVSTRPPFDPEGSRLRRGEG